ncbi:PhzF family phenazine biosynthesis protein [Aneurinibacillus sp. REN35]|uniref:PhzF family phenazine biosynthesis protein n=1 Tax=Aneurinibacillus sp. REN35 TaxID=3237286 RepID=UPI003527D113
MEIIEAYTLRAFTKAQQGGNPAGVVLDADAMSEEAMQQVAARLGFSETAFILSSVCADRRIRFFTPNAEVDLCGHATIAAFSLLTAQQLIGYGLHTIETKAGVLQVETQEGGEIFLAQASPCFAEKVDRARIAASLRIQQDDLIHDLPLQIVSTGLRDIFIPVKSLAVLQAIEPDFAQIAEVSRAYAAVGYHVFTLDTGTEAIARCRNFAPLYDIPEESATGTATGALSCYLYQYGKVEAKQLPRLLFEQGYTMNCPSDIQAKIAVDSQGEIVSVHVGGMASTAERKSILLV